jgi:hypothetical protein
VRRVLEAFGGATMEGGRVDLFVCNLLASKEAKAIFKEVEALKKCNFAASTNIDVKDTSWVMESDNIDVKDIFFHDRRVFDSNSGIFWALVRQTIKIKYYTHL